MIIFIISLIFYTLVSFFRVKDISHLFVNRDVVVKKELFLIKDFKLDRQQLEAKDLSTVLEILKANHELELPISYTIKNLYFIGDRVYISLDMRKSRALSEREESLFIYSLVSSLKKEVMFIGFKNSKLFDHFNNGIFRGIDL